MKASGRFKSMWASHLRDVGHLTHSLPPALCFTDTKN